MFNVVVVKYLPPVTFQAVSRLVRGSNLLDFVFTCHVVMKGHVTCSHMLAHISRWETDEVLAFLIDILGKWGVKGRDCPVLRVLDAEQQMPLCLTPPWDRRSGSQPDRCPADRCLARCHRKVPSLPLLLGNSLHFFPSQSLPHLHPSRPVTSTQHRSAGPVARRGSGRGGQEGSPVQLALLSLLLPPTAGSRPSPKRGRSKRGRSGERACNLTIICICWHLHWLTFTLWKVVGVQY